MSEFAELNISRIEAFLKDNSYNISDNLRNEYNNIKEQLENLVGIKKIYFNINLSDLIKVMK